MARSIGKRLARLSLFPKYNVGGGEPCHARCLPNRRSHKREPYLSIFQRAGLRRTSERSCEKSLSPRTSSVPRLPRYGALTSCRQRGCSPRPSPCLSPRRGGERGRNRARAPFPPCGGRCRPGGATDEGGRAKRDGLELPPRKASRHSPSRDGRPSTPYSAPPLIPRRMRSIRPQPAPPATSRGTRSVPLTPARGEGARALPVNGKEPGVAARLLASVEKLDRTPSSRPGGAEFSRRPGRRRRS